MKTNALLCRISIAGRILTAMFVVAGVVSVPVQSFVAFQIEEQETQFSHPPLQLAEEAFGRARAPLRRSSLGSRWTLPLRGRQPQNRATVSGPLSGCVSLLLDSYSKSADPRTEQSEPACRGSQRTKTNHRVGVHSQRAPTPKTERAKERAPTPNTGLQSVECETARLLPWVAGSLSLPGPGRCSCVTAGFVAGTGVLHDPVPRGFISRSEHQAVVNSKRTFSNSTIGERLPRTPCSTRPLAGLGTYASCDVTQNSL